MSPEDSGIAHIECNKNKNKKYIQFITCKKCNTPLRMQIQAKKNEHTYKTEDQWWHIIEPMVFVNSCWWFCTECYPYYPDKTPLLPTENRTGFLNSAIQLLLITKTKPYGVEFKV